MRLSIVLAAALFLLPLACGPRNQEAQNPPNVQPIPSATTTTATTATSTTLAVPTPSAACQSLPPVAGMGADVILTGLAAQEAPGAQPEGTAFAAQCTDGQTLEQPINLAPGKCYTVVATSIGGVVELDVMIQAQLAPAPLTTLAQDSTAGPTATLGGKADGCWKNPSPVPIPGKIVLRMTKGQGAAAAKVYVR